MDVMSVPTAAPAAATPGVAPVVPGSFLLGSALDLRRDMLGLRACLPALRRRGAFSRRPARGAARTAPVVPSRRRAPRAGRRSTNYRKENVFYSELRSAFGDGLLTTQDVQWQRQKRFLQPLFAPSG